MGRRKVNAHVSGDDAQPAARHPSTTASVAMSVSPSPSPIQGPAPPPAKRAEPLGQTNASTMPGPSNAFMTTRGQKRKAMTLEPPGETTLDQSQRRRQNSDADYIATGPVPVQEAQTPGYYPGTQYGVSGPYSNQHSMRNSRQGSASHRAPSQSAGPYYPPPGTAMTQYGRTTGQANYSMTPNSISASRNPSIPSTEFAPHYPLPPIRPSPTPSQMSTQMPPAAHPQPQHPSEMGQITMVPPAAVIRDLQAHVRKVEEVNAVRLRHLSDLASRLRQSDAANAGLRKELKHSIRVSGHAARLESLSSDEMLQLFINSLQRDTRNLNADKEQLEMEIIRLKEELNKVVNGLPRDTAPIVRENLELKAKLQRSAWILASIEKQVARGMEPENSAGGPSGQ
ncbi:uncharacterized protein APUU_10249S [Aspergillus puulaauensis]|uniref:Uncharacterized protein n=1 Tax=Aspergillus puulaauensis TaxID=1220207 RepID=A0A7R7X9V2_9EURO|nr:uncharacterized protein APUU_10249S [Aspergillus puulaauensis]BCS17421.1 hypothetical protein APUU_10249S [Aspergillus puulaauensis]